MTILYSLGLVFLGIVIGAGLLARTYLVGALRVDFSDVEDGPFMRLELFENVDAVSKRNYIMLKVKKTPDTHK